MKTLLIASPGGTSQLLQCPQGKTIRILAIFGTYNGGVGADIVGIGLDYAGTLVMVTQSQLIANGAGDFCCFIGNIPVPLVASDTDVRLPLPEATFDKDVTVTARGGITTINTILYERGDA